MKHTHSKGFTLIELLVVIGIISLLSSVIFASVNVARAKARDARKETDLASVNTALTLFHNDKSVMPKNYLNTDGSYNAAGTGNAIAFENPSSPSSNSNKAYEASMAELVSGGYLSAIPHSPGGGPYGYYDYGPNSLLGAMFSTSLETTHVTPGITAKSCTTGYVWLCTMFVDSNGNHVSESNPNAICSSGYAVTGPKAAGSQIVYTYTPPGPAVIEPGYLTMVTYSDYDYTKKNICNPDTTTELCICNPY